MDKPRIRDLVVNRKARHEYLLHDRFEAGLSLLGSEVKSLRMGRGNLQEAYVRRGTDGAWLVGCHISPYSEANRNNHEPLRPRRLLLHRNELLKLKRGTAMKVECDAHDFMHGFVFVAKNPYYAVVGEDGSYTIDNVPPGKYTIKAFHGTLKDQKSKVQVKAGKSMEVNFEFKGK